MTDLEKENAELLAHIERFKSVVEAVAHIGVDFGYGAYEIQTDTIDLARGLLSETPSAALATLKAQWQAEAVREVAADIREMTGTHTHYSVSLMAARVDGIADSIERLEKIRQRTQGAV